MLTNDLFNKYINFIELFRDQARKNADKPALVFEGNELTYGQLDLSSNQIAHMINTSHANEKLAVLLLSNPLAQITAMIGVLKSGLCYIPLDPSYPEETNEYILKDSSAKLIITEAEQLPLVNKIADGDRTVFNMSEAKGYSSGNTSKPVTYDDYSYILYTSGSTGQPKGVAHSHLNLTHLISIYSADIQIRESDRFTYLYSYSFSAGIKDVFAALACGATVYPYLIKTEGVKRLIHYLRDNRITVYHSVPTVFRHLCAELSKDDICFPDLRLISLGSEAITKKDFQLYAKYFPDNCRLHIEYGITETGVITQYFMDKSTPLPTHTIPVGSPVFGKEITLVDDLGNPVEPDGVGEIVIKSPYIAKGYWKHGQLKPLPGTDSLGSYEVRVFKTGDLGRWRADGCLDHLGRKDNQVKIHGYKINIGELEAILSNLELVKEAVVVMKENKAGDNSLAAFIVTQNDNEQPDDLVFIKETLRQKIPEYMIPARFIKLDQLPKLPNGKNDRQKLINELKKNGERAGSYSTDIIEQAVALIYADIVDVKDFSVNDSIFELGANSMTASQVCSTIEDWFKIDFPVAHIFNQPSVSGLARLITESGEQQEQLAACARKIISMAGQH